jgi:hypothetical protein
MSNIIFIYISYEKFIPLENPPDQFFSFGFVLELYLYRVICLGV